jgi:hypothetical protein
MKHYYNNNSAIRKAYRLVQHDRIEHVNVDRCFIKEQLGGGSTSYKSVQGQLIDIHAAGNRKHTLDSFEDGW